MVSLYIENQFIELDNTVQFAITKQFEDITTPTSIINDWSKTVSIPFTENNNKTFGNIFNPDRITVYDSNSEFTTGIYFDPLKKLDFKLYWDSALLMNGYAKLNTVTKSNGKGRYNITLNGELGKVFQEMKKITFDKSTEDTKYLIDGSKYVEETINKDLVYDLWSNGGGLNTTLYENTDESYRLSEIIGFAPNNSYNDEFDYKTFQKKNENTSEKFEEVLDRRAKQVAGNDEATYQSLVGVAADTVIGEGLLPREIGEYRSYMQLPYIYFNKLFQIFTKKTEDITGYKVVLDNNWFNVANPYWSKLVYMLKQFNTNVDIKAYSGTFTNTNLLNATTTTNANGGTTWTPPLFDSPVWTSLISNNSFMDEVVTDFTKNKFNHISFYQELPIKLLFNNVTSGNTGNPCTSDYITLGNTFNIAVKFRVKDQNGNVVYTTPPSYIYDGGTGSYDIGNIVLDKIPKKSSGVFEATVNVPFGLSIDKNLVGDDFDIEVGVYTYSTRWNYPMSLYDTIDNMPVIAHGFNVSALPTNITINTSNKKRSNSRFVLNDLWNNEVNLFDEIINYCKQYRIGVFCNDVHKTLIFKPLNIYFADYKVIDWTDKLDISKNYTIQPITFDNKYVLFNYEKNDVQLNKSYNESFGTNYGEYKLITDYEFNNDEKKLFNNVHNVMTSTDNILNWEDLYTKTKVVYTLPAELYVSNKDKDKKNISVFGSMLFFKGIVNFDTEYDLRPVKISDDTNFQTLTQTYFYSQDGEEGCNVRCDKYPLLDIVYDTNLCLFNTPMENYTYIPNHYDNTKGIYTNFWKQYLDERYNTNNKIVTCYLHISPTDYMNFEFNKFIKIENQLYMVNKIYDYDITNNSTTKVDLITIQNINGYIENDFNKNFTIFKFYNPNEEIYNSRVDYIDLKNAETETWYVSSSSDVNWSFINLPANFPQSELAKISVNGETISGAIQAGIKVPINIKNNGTDLNATILFENQQGFSVSVNIRTFFKEMQFFNSSNNVIYEYDMLLENVGQTKTIYMTANTPVAWRDVNSSLLGVQVYYNNNTSTGAYQEGTIPAGTKVPITFKMVDSTTQSGAIEFTNGIDSFTVDVQKELNTKFTVYDTDKTEYNTSDKVVLENTSPLTKTIYITSPNTDVSWNDNGTNLQDLYVNGAAGSGTISKGTLVPVTLTMEVGDNESRDMPVYGEIKFYTPQKTVIIDIMLIWNRIFDIYRWDGEIWKEDFDYIELTPSEPMKTIYLSANDEVEWSDVSGDLQNLYLSTDQDAEDWGNYTRGSGTIYPPSNMKPIHFRMDKQGQQGTDTGKVSFFNGKHEWFVDVVLRG